MSDYFINYLAANVFCLLVFGLLLVHDLLSVDRQEKQIKYDRTLVAFMGYFVTDVFWAAAISGVIPRNIYTVVLTNLGNYVFMAAITFEWLNYVMAVQQAPDRNKPKSRFTVIFPFMLATVALVVTYIISPRTLVDENLDITAVFMAFQIAVPIFYIVTVLVFALRKARFENNPIERKKLLYIGFFPLTVVVGGIIQVSLLPKLPIFCFCSTFLMLRFYIQSMETQISIDGLTKLNNRTQLMRYVTQNTNFYKEDRMTFVVMIDVNDFKQINDTYGHAEGDRALMIIADSLKAVSKTRNISAFLGRYGGDEFIMIVYPESEEELAVLASEIRREIEQECRGNQTPYIISIAIGYEQLLNSQDTFQKCIQRADTKLYQDKETMKHR